MLNIAIPPTFESERRYVLEVLLEVILGFSFVVVVDCTVQSVVLSLPNGNQLKLVDHFFEKYGDTFLEYSKIPTSVRLSHVPFAPESDLPIIFGYNDVVVETGRILCQIDLVASAFFMLTRWEESVNKVRDGHERFPGLASVAFRDGFLHRPVVNEYAEMLYNMLRHLGYTSPRKQRVFKWDISHDVDFPWRWNGLTNGVRVCAGDILKRRDIKLALTNLKSFVHTKYLGRSDPYDTFSNLMNLSEAVGAQSQFNFMSGGSTKYDSSYSVKDHRIQSLFREIQTRGHQIGFHPSYNTLQNPQQWTNEHKLLEESARRPVRKGRQHYLRCNVPQLWNVWEDNGMEYDSTLGYADAPGFRCGICDPYPVFNVLTRQKLKLIEVPLIAMEGSFIIYQQQTPNEMAQKVKSLVESVRKYKGTFTLLWHNSSFNVHPWQPFEKVYANILSY